MAERVPPPPGPEPEPGDPIATAIVPFVEPRDTYVVKVPKDQIFRVPPPENARLAEFYRSRHDQRKPFPCLPYLWWFLGIVAAVAALVLVSILIFYLCLKPELPTFSVEHLTAKSPQSPRPEYDITLKARNPNARIEYIYESGGKSVLSCRGVKIASGEPQKFHLEANGKAELLKQVIEGAKRNALPQEVKKSLNGSKDVVALSLSETLPVSLRARGLRSWSKNVAVECKIGTRALGKETKLVSQQCT